MTAAAEFWTTGDYAVVGDLWAQPGRDVAATLAVRDRDVVDLATGTGVTAIAAARHGARSVTGVDVTPDLLREAVRRSRAAGVDVDWIEADLTDVPLPTDCADLVTSTFGLVFAEPGPALAEARRLVRPGGRVVFTSWAAEGLFGRIRQALAPYFPGAPEPWHEERDAIRSLAGADATVEVSSFTMTIESPEQFVSLLERFSAPIVNGAASLGDAWPSARRDLVRVVEEVAGDADPDGHRVPVDYLVTTLSG